MTQRDITRVQLQRAFYTIDDGQSFFTDSIHKIYPFDHQGKAAYRAYVYQCEEGKPFVAYLARYTEKAVGRLRDLQKNGSPEAEEELSRIIDEQIEVKLPGQTKWVPLFSEDGQRITRNLQCPDGQIAQSVIP